MILSLKHVKNVSTVNVGLICGVNQAWVYDEGMIAGEKVNNLVGVVTMTDMIKFYYARLK